MSGIVWTTAAFGVGAIFIGVSVYRIVSISRLPVHLRWELAPVPAEKTKSEHGGSYLEDSEYWRRPRHRALAFQAGYMAWEILLLRGVWRRNRSLWPLSYSLHAGIYLLFLTLLLVIIDVALLQWAPGSAPVYERVATWPALVGYMLGALGATGLIVRRGLDAGMRSFSAFTSYFNLALLAAVFISGAYGWFRGPAFVAGLGLFVKGVVAPGMASAPGLATTLHVIFFLAFMLYLPFSNMFHFAAKFFTYHEVRWDDRPIFRGSALENEITGLLQKPVGWSAIHIPSGKTWAEIAAEQMHDEKTS